MTYPVEFQYKSRADPSMDNVEHMYHETNTLNMEQGTPGPALEKMILYNNIPSLLVQCHRIWVTYSDECHRLLEDTEQCTYMKQRERYETAYGHYMEVRDTLLNKIPLMPEFNDFFVRDRDDQTRAHYLRFKELVEKDRRINDLREKLSQLRTKKTFFTGFLKQSWISEGTLRRILLSKSSGDILVIEVRELSLSTQHPQDSKFNVCIDPILIKEQETLSKLEHNLEKVTKPGELFYFRGRNDFEYIVICVPIKELPSGTGYKKSVILFEKIITDLKPRTIDQRYPKLYMCSVNYDAIITKNDLGNNSNMAGPAFSIQLPLFTGNNPQTLSNTHKPNYTSPTVIKGIQNEGNCCYMNCIIQCLLCFPEFTNKFLDNAYLGTINVNSRLGHQGLVVKNWAKIIQAFFQVSQENIQPAVSITEFREQWANLFPEYGKYQQHDCSEFCLRLLEEIHEDSNWGRPQNSDAAMQVDDYREAWNLYRKGNSSYIVDTFKGQIKSQLTCQVCQTQSNNYEPFSILNLPIPLVSMCHIYDCMKELFKVHVLTGDDRWYCSTCKTKTHSTLGTTITNVPEVLIIHFNRFDNLLNKKECFVKYPYLLDLSQGNGLLGKCDVPYKLVAVACHTGTLFSGHYTAYCFKNSENGWYHFDDTQCKPVSNGECISQSAYLLFYQKQQ
ncbi:putative ubiquitin-specific protease UBP5 KNAG_0G01590 [Huiozyma naganishii CBS 8797]|uniref:Ubiquitin carboxyl-terminal hydrolase n=1 Tax=Huiozyma naganishii (strain ATCC MYA-139 / BCRC 22969 / CBS 8797 / KCTC 17520 / NBRC 10181 / NCYC 3082 / Yp74L-3) TaxID=1071383 RepID=J7S0Y5_HUIN7|nr:hypothetical protein KNAG_0G01590 [Kazachstania naganishii CBS 8797]CCK71217.1 hypothetical protein KNAG_0G01590 [Kazachstania naganishii CBS 8797]